MGYYYCHYRYYSWSRAWAEFVVWVRRGNRKRIVVGGVEGCLLTKASMKGGVFEGVESEAFQKGRARVGETQGTCP